jgi:hypothetical protein
MELLEKDSSKMGRMSFLKYSGLAVASSAIIMQSSCKKDDDDNTGGVNLGSGDTGILNYAYALEQLEAAFYTQVMASPYTGITAAESQILSDLQKHEVAHREFFKAALGGNAIVSLEVDFSMIDFTSRTSVLNTAKAFEDLGVSAYNGAGKLLVSADYLLLAGKIVSVEARHAAAIRDLLSPNTASFAGNDVVNTQGLDGAKTPAEVLAIAGTYLKSSINASNLPTS